MRFEEDLAILVVTYKHTSVLQLLTSDLKENMP